MSTLPSSRRSRTKESRRWIIIIPQTATVIIPEDKIQTTLQTIKNIQIVRRVSNVFFQERQSCHFYKREIEEERMSDKILKQTDYRVLYFIFSYTYRSYNSTKHLRGLDSPRLPVLTFLETSCTLPTPVVSTNKLQVRRQRIN